MLHLLLVIQPIQVSAWAELVKEAGITVAALGGVLTSVIGIVNFFYARHIRLDAKHIKQLAARNAQVSHNGQKAIGQKVDDVRVTWPRTLPRQKKSVRRLM